MLNHGFIHNHLLYKRRVRGSSPGGGTVETQQSPWRDDPQAPWNAAEEGCVPPTDWNQGLGFTQKSVLLFPTLELTGSDLWLLWYGMRLGGRAKCSI